MVEWWLNGRGLLSSINVVYSDINKVKISALNPRIAKEGVVSTPSTFVYKFSRNFFEFF